MYDWRQIPPRDRLRVLSLRKHHQLPWHCPPHFDMGAGNYIVSGACYEPVKHGYVDKWQQWPYSSAGAFLKAVGRKRAEEIWREYPILDYGKDWDI